jgi:hypothetical protein
MNFFQHQEQARKNTRKLILLFAIAILCIVAALYFVGLGIYQGAIYGQAAKAGFTYRPPVFSWWDPRILGWVVAGTLVIIGCGSLYKIYSLGRGGAVVAEMLGGRLVDRDTTKLPRCSAAGWLTATPPTPMSGSC